MHFFKNDNKKFIRILDVLMLGPTKTTVMEL